jgi:WD40 repeat protein
MEWAGRDSSTLIFGVPEGISILRFDSRESISPTHLAHPQGRSVSQIAVAPHGRLVATLSRGDSFILVWDIILGTSTSVYCLQAAFDSDLSWSPSGNHIIIGQRYVILL